MGTPVQSQAYNQHVNLYKAQQIATASPGDLLLYLYDALVAACAVGDRDKTLRGLEELINSLNFEHAESANGMLRLHQYCIDQVQQGHFEEAYKIISELRDAWQTVLRNAPNPSFEDAANTT